MIFNLNTFSNCSFNSAHKQVWKTKSFSYLNSPRPDYGFMFLYKGSMKFVYQKGVLEAQTGDIIFLPRGCYYEVFFNGDEENTADYLVNFSAFSESEFDQPMRILQNASPSFIELFERVLRASVEGESSYYCNGSMFFLFDRIENAFKESDNHAKGEIITKAVTLLSGADNLSIKNIAKECGVSESGLRKLFTDEYGVSPVEYRQKERVKRAEYLLESTTLSVKEIAYALNFYDESYFCRTFFKHTGQTPKEYSKNRKL